MNNKNQTAVSFYELKVNGSTVEWCVPKKRTRRGRRWVESSAELVVGADVFSGGGGGGGGGGGVGGRLVEAELLVAQRPERTEVAGMDQLLAGVRMLELQVRLQDDSKTTNPKRNKKKPR